MNTTITRTSPRPPTVAGAAGISLMESMVALMVIAIVLTFGLPSFQKFRADMVQRQGVNQILEDLHAARQLAVTQRSPVVVSFGNGVTTTNLTTYRVHRDKNDDRVVQSTELTVPSTMHSDCKLAEVSLQPTDSLLFDISGILKSGTNGGYIVVQTKNVKDTLMVSVAGMVYEK